MVVRHCRSDSLRSLYLFVLKLGLDNGGEGSSVEGPKGMWAVRFCTVCERLPNIPDSDFHLLHPEFLGETSLSIGVWPTVSVMKAVGGLKWVMVACLETV